jgi:hypothetical protein
VKPGDLVTLKTHGSQFPLSPFHGKIHMIKEIQGDTVVLLGVVGWVYLSEVELIHETR